MIGHKRGKKKSKGKKAKSSKGIDDRQITNQLRDSAVFEADAGLKELFTRGAQRQHEHEVKEQEEERRKRRALVCNFPSLSLHLSQHVLSLFLG